MIAADSIETDRLLLRHWRADDLDNFAVLNQDDEVMEFLPKKLSREESAQFIEKINAHFAQHGFGLFACEEKKSGHMIGYVGLNVATFKAHFTPATEIGWRLARPYWGRGYATEAAAAIVRVAFSDYALKELVSFTVPGNNRSRRVMEKLGMRYDARDDFAHPALPEGHPLRKHILYRIHKH